MNNKISMSKELDRMQVGETKSFPAKSLNSVKVMASNKGFMLDRKYRCNIDKENRVVNVTRDR